MSRDIDGRFIPQAVREAWVKQAEELKMKNIETVKICPHCGTDTLSEGSEIGLSHCWDCGRNVEAIAVQMDLDTGEIAK